MIFVQNPTLFSKISQIPVFFGQKRKIPALFGSPDIKVKTIKHILFITYDHDV